MRLIPAMMCLALALNGCRATSPTQPEFDPLLTAIEHRLDLAVSVATHKWKLTLPVQAPEREQQVLAKVCQDAPDYDLDPPRAAAFFSDQIEANKLVQYTLIDRWNALGSQPTSTSRDLVHELRPRLDTLQATLLDELRRFDLLDMRDCPKKLASALQQRTNDPLRHIALVRATAQLCVKS